MKVYATSRHPQPQRDDRIVPLILDVADDTSVAATARQAPDVSILVNNAGISLATPILDAPLADIRSELDTTCSDHPRRASVRTGPRQPPPQLDDQRPLSPVVGLVRRGL